jgi:hypothetical protein
MPGDGRINLRAPKQALERFQQAAELRKMSLTTFMLFACHAVADKLLDERAQLVETTEPTPARPASVQKVSENVRPTPSEIPKVAEPVQELPKPAGWIYWNEHKRKNWLARNGQEH